MRSTVESMLSLHILFFFTAVEQLAAWTALDVLTAELSYRKFFVFDAYAEWRPSFYESRAGHYDVVMFGIMTASKPFTLGTRNADLM